MGVHGEPPQENLRKQIVAFHVIGFVLGFLMGVRDYPDAPPHGQALSGLLRGVAMIIWLDVAALLVLRKK